MTRIDTLIIQGHKFHFLSGEGDCDGVIIPTETPQDALCNPDFLEALAIAREIHPDHQEYANAANYGTLYIPKYRLVSENVRDARDYFINHWVNSSKSAHEKALAYRSDLSEIKRMRREKEGYVYLIRAIEPQSHYKIGLSKNPVTRIESLDVILPYPVEVIHLIKTDNMRGLEKSLHKQFEDKRVNGEWFALADADVQAICAMKGIE